MELMGSTSPSSYSAVLELDRKIRELSAVINIHEDEQVNHAAQNLELSCILGAIMRQNGEPCSLSPPCVGSASWHRTCVRLLGAIFDLNCNIVRSR